MKILNLTQHAATEEQIASGVYEPQDKAGVQRLLTFESLPSMEEIEARSFNLAGYPALDGATAAMIGGAPFLMPALDAALRKYGITPVYAFSVRESVDQTQQDGSVRKVAVFRHAGFVGL